MLMSYEVWVIALLVFNTVWALASGAIAIWQRHQTIRKLKADAKFPQVHQPRTWVPVKAKPDPGFDDIVALLKEIEHEAGKSDRQDKGAGKDRPSCCK